MEHAEEAATEAEPQTLAHLGLESETGVVEAELAQRLPAEHSQGSLLLVGYSPLNTIGLGSLWRPSSTCSVGFRASVTVSPMWTSARSLIWAMK